ncbi:MAG TPA: HipA N-terminal domain-containing protein [Bacteroidales bacterium]|nr:HipA N-terminal domain-containing protein [Bacteroidales bacterium]
MNRRNVVRKADIFIHKMKAGLLSESDDREYYTFEYLKDYDGPPLSVAVPVSEEPYTYKIFPPFFEGLLPEGTNLEALLGHQNIDRKDYFTQLITVGTNLVGAVTVEEHHE